MSTLENSDTTDNMMRLIQENDSWAISLMHTMSIEIHELDSIHSRLTMPVKGNIQLQGLLHGGASAVLAETAGSLCAWVHAQKLYPDLGYAVGVELNISHLRSASHGIVTAVARSMHLGRTSTVHCVDITDQNGKIISTARISNRILAKPQKQA